MTTTADRVKVANEACHCVHCSSCGGSGSYWADFRGRYLGQHRCDDLDELEYCEECGGSGIIEVCDRCELLTDIDYEDELKDAAI